MRRPVTSGWNDDPSSRIAETRPSIALVPDVGSVVPARIFRSVLFPEPFSPTMPTTAPRGTVADTPRSAWTSRCRFRPVTSSTSLSRGLA